MAQGDGHGFVTDWASQIRPEDSDSADDIALAEEEAFAFAEKGKGENAKFEERMREAQLRSFEQDIAERKTYANKIFWLVFGWLAAVFLLVLWSGSSFIPVSISDAVLIALVSGVSVNVIALFAIVANYLFPKRKW